MACYCLPAGDAPQGLPILPPRTRGNENWLMYCGNVKFLASVKPDAKPESLVWGGKYEASLTPATKAPAKTIVAQATDSPKASPRGNSAPPAKAAGSAPAPRAGLAAAQAAQRERYARREAQLNNGIFRDLVAKHPALAGMDVHRQLIVTEEFWDKQDHFNEAAFGTFLKRLGMDDKGDK